MKTTHATDCRKSFRRKFRNTAVGGTTIFALVTCAALAPSWAIVEGIGTRNKKSSSIKSKKESTKLVADQEINTTLAIKRNVGNFKKGFAGESSVSAVSNSPFYKLDVIAKQGSQGISSIFLGSTLNGNGSVLFAGRNVDGSSVFIGDSINAPQPIVVPVFSGAFYGGTVQLNDNDRSISWLSANSTQSLIVRDGLNQSVAPLVATNGAKAQDRFDQVDAAGSVNKFGWPVFSGVRNNLLTLASGYRFGYTFLKQYSSGLGGTLRPMVSDNGVVVVREIDTGQVQRIVLFNYGLTGVSTIIADGTRFNNVGTSPGVSDDGKIVVFQGDLKADSGSTSYNSFYGTTSGPGIFASIDLGTGARKLVRLAGIQSEDQSQPGIRNGICEASEICIADELGYTGSSTGSGNPIKLFDFDTTTRVGVVRQDLGTLGLTGDSFVTAFVGTPNDASPSALFSNQTGLWTVRTDIKTLPDGSLSYIVGKAKPVIQLNDTIDGSVVSDIAVYDPISNATNDDLKAPRVASPGDHRVAFWVNTNSGPMMVRGTFFDSDEDGLPDHWEQNGVTIGGKFINLPAMGASARRRDIFVQANWFDPGSGIVFKPRLSALRKVIDAFKNAPFNNPDGTTGINIHIDAGPNSVMNPQTDAKWNTLSRAGSFPYIQPPLLFGDFYPGTPRYDWKDFDILKFINPNGQSPQTESFFQSGRAAIFRLALFVDKWAGQNNSGLSRSIPATDFMVSLGTSFTAQQRGTIAQGSTFMHELGHNLNLRHGGNDNVNWKPNYISIMNYRFQLGGLIKSDNSPEINYSVDALNMLTETNLDESVGIGDPSHRTAWFGPAPACSVQKSTQTSIDWNVNSTPNEIGVSADINGDSPSGCDPLGSVSVLKGHNDWLAVNLSANGALGGNGAGSSGNPGIDVSSERTVQQIIAATPPDLMLRQGCEPVDETTLTISGSQAPVTVNFDASASTAPCGNIVSYSWNFGDGTNGTGAQTSHIYSNQGAYQASLTLVDSDGNTTLIPSKYQIAVTNNYSISGQIKDESGNGLSGVSVNLSGGQSTSVQTNATGNYSFANVISGESYTVSPVKQGYRFTPSNRVYNNLSSSQTADFNAVLGSTPPRVTTSDFDRDGRSDLSVVRPSDNKWYLQQSQLGYTFEEWGVAGDLLTPADFDGDGRTELGIFRPSTGEWYTFNVTTRAFTVIAWGQSGDLPVPADRDGDGKADYVLFRPSTSTWYIKYSDDLSFTSTQFGATGDKPVIGDFDGNRQSDIAVWRPSNGTWFVQHPTLGFISRGWGENGDKSVPADYDGDGKTDFAVFRPSNNTWYRVNSSDGAELQSTWGEAGDIAAPADYDGDGKSDIAVFRPSNGTWYIINSTTGLQVQQFGQTGDVPTQSSFIY